MKLTASQQLLRICVEAAATRALADVTSIGDERCVDQQLLLCTRNVNSVLYGDVPRFKCIIARRSRLSAMFIATHLLVRGLIFLRIPARNANVKHLAH